MRSTLWYREMIARFHLIALHSDDEMAEMLAILIDDFQLEVERQESNGPLPVPPATGP